MFDRLVAQNVNFRLSSRSIQERMVDVFREFLSSHHFRSSSRTSLTGTDTLNANFKEKRPVTLRYKSTSRSII